MSLSLGEQLANRQALSKAGQIAEKERIARESDKQKREDYATMEAYLNKVRDQLVEQIHAAEVHPRVEGPRRFSDPISNLMTQSTRTGVHYIGRNYPGICYEDSPFHALWQSQVEWFLENGLVLEACYEHDGVGMESWHSFRVSPVKKA